MKKIIFTLFLCFLITSCKKKEFEIHPNLIGTWRGYIPAISGYRFFSFDKSSVSLFKFENASTNYEIIDYSQDGESYPILVTLKCKIKSKNNKNAIEEFEFNLLSEDTLKYTGYGPDFWYYKL